MATRRASPALASQAEKARRIIGEDANIVELSWSVQRDKVINRESIMPSKQSRAESKWVRWKARPARPSMKADERAN